MVDPINTISRKYVRGVMITTLLLTCIVVIIITTLLYGIYGKHLGIASLMISTASYITTTISCILTILYIP